MRERGFTLIELLVVIAIIAILAAILFPVFAQAREKARQASCQSNLKQIAVGFAMYMSDYDQRWPYWHWGRHREAAAGANAKNALQWYVRLYPYVKNTQLFECPSRSDEGGCRWCYANPGDSRYIAGMPQFPRVHYGYNEPMSNNCCGRGKESNIKHPAEVLLVGDCRAVLGGWEANNLRLLWRFAVAGTGSPCIGCGGTVPANAEDFTAHTGGSNIAFFDGHVKWIRWMNIRRPPDGGAIRYRAYEW
ncbi:MAG TPA: DUF1559 domain-containing protein [Armatimonadetes bacterium]|nr:DUF1559 domain-containing protein [Armatimonadota bacterium]